MGALYPSDNIWIDGLIAAVVVAPAWENLAHGASLPSTQEDCAIKRGIEHPVAKRLEIACAAYWNRHLAGTRSGWSPAGHRSVQMTRQPHPVPTNDRNRTPFPPFAESRSPALGRDRLAGSPSPAWNPPSARAAQRSVGAFGLPPFGSGGQESPATGRMPRRSVLARKLAQFVPLSASEENVIDRLLTREEHLLAHVDIVTEGAGSLPAFVVKEGMAIRYRILPGGGRQIIAFLLPGDLCGDQSCLPAIMDHSISTLSPMRVAPIPNAALRDAAARHPRIADALHWCSAQEGAILRERIVSLGRRDARGRLAHLLCELLWRHRAVGLAEGNRFCLPLTQVELGDALGLTPVHVNKVLQEFRKRGLITLERKMLDVLDLGSLRAIAELDDAYLKSGGASGGREPPPDTWKRSAMSG